MAISKLVGVAQSYDRPSVFAMQANDNMVKESSDLLNLAISDFSSFLSKTNDSLQDLRDSSTKTIDGFSKVIRDLTNLDKNIRFKFTYLRKEIESSRNDFLTALRSISFDFAGGGYGDGGGDLPFTETTQTKITGVGPPVIPPVIPPPGGPGNKPGKPGNKPGKPGNKPGKPGNKPGIGQRIKKMLGSPKPPAALSDDLKPKPKPKPVRVRVPPAPAIDMSEVTKRVRAATGRTPIFSMKYTPPKGPGAKFNTGGAATGRFGLTGPGYGNVTTNVPGTPQKMTPKVKKAFQAATVKTLEMAKGVLGFNGGVANKVMSGVGAAMAVYTVADAYMKHYQALNRPPNQRNEKEIEDTLKAFQISIFDALGIYLGANAGAMIGGLIPVPVVGSLVGGIAGAEAGGILGRSLGRKIVKGEDFFEALKDETYKVAEAAQVKPEELEQIRNVNIQTSRRLYGNRDDSNTELFSPYGMTDSQIVEKINQSRFLKEEYLKWKQTEEGKKSKQVGNAEWYRSIKMKDDIGDDNATNFNFSSKATSGLRSWLGMNQNQNVKQGPGSGSGGPAEPDLKGSGLEYQSRQTDPMNMMASYRNMEMDMNPEVYNMSDEVSEGDPNHPTGPMSVLPTADQMGGSTIHAFIYRQSQRDAFGRETNSIIA